MSCLIIKNDGIGDLILSSGLISSVGELFEGKVDLLTCGANREIAQGIEPLRKRFYVSRDVLRFKKGRVAKLGLLIPHITNEDQAVLRAIEKQCYDTIICLRRFIRESTLVLMRKVHGAKKYCAWEFPTNASWNMAERATRTWKHNIGSAEVLSELDYNKAFLENILKTTITAEPHLSFCQKQIEQPVTRTLALGIGGGSTNWPYGNWIELAILLSKGGWSVILLGGDNVTDLADQIMKKIPTADNKVGQLTWPNTAELLLKCNAYIGNDTGLSHFASLILQKCLMILGGGTFRRFFPWPNVNNQHVIYHGLDCFDCTWACKFKDRFCLSLVRPVDVFNYFNEVVNEEAKPECDLNPINIKYQICKREKAEFSEANIRPLLMNTERF